MAGHLSELVVERDRELDGVRERLDAVEAEREQAVAAVLAIGRHLEQIRSQARGQATRIRMRALREAAEIDTRAREAGERSAGPTAGARGDAAGVRGAHLAGAGDAAGLAAAPNGAAGDGVFDGLVHVDIGPLSDFSQLVRFEDAASAIGAAGEITIKRFSGGRARVAMSLSEPVELLRELEERCDLELHVRRAGEDEIVLDVGDE